MTDTDVNYARTHSAMDVAGHLLYLADNDTPSQQMIPMKLLKLVYIAHGWMLALHGRPLLWDHPEAWKYGPMIPALYESYARTFRGDPIIEIFRKSETLAVDEEAQSIVEQTWLRYGPQDPHTLSALCHQKGTPWADTWKDGEGAFEKIPNEEIKMYYGKLLRVGQKEQAEREQKKKC